MPTKREYNGWFNYEIWMVNLYFDDYFWDDVEIILVDCVDEFSNDDAATIREKATERLASLIEETIAEHVENCIGKDLFVADMVGATMREINYWEMARHYIDDLELYAAGWNMPGYMPDSDPTVFLTVEAARDYIADEMDRAADQEIVAHNSDEAMNLLVVADNLAATATRCREGKGEFGETVGDYHYWVYKV